jgi:hypothetical protein
MLGMRYVFIYKTQSFGYFPSDNDRIENATHNTLPKKAGDFNFNLQHYLAMYCGLHFQFRRAYYHLYRIFYGNFNLTYSLELHREYKCKKWSYQTSR